MPNKDQEHISIQLKRFISLLDETITSLNDQERLNNPMLRFFPKQFAETLPYFEKLDTNDTKGYCLGFSVCRAGMRITGQLDWWKRAVDKVCDWNGKLESLSNTYILSDEEEGEQIPLYKILERLLHYIVFNQGGYADISQLSILDPGGPFLVLNNKNEKIQIKNNFCIAGSFPKNNMIDLLQNGFLKSILENNICIVHSLKHACELSYSNYQWHFFDPNYLSGEAKSFDSTEDLVHEIIDRLDQDICIEVACVEDIKLNPFTTYIRNADLNSLIKDDGFMLISRYTPNLIPYIISELNKKFSFDIISEIINCVPLDGYTPLYNAASRNCLTAVIALLQAGADPNHLHPHSTTVLMRSIRNSSHEMVTELLAKNADPNIIDDYGNTALSLAIKQDNKQILDILLNHKNLKLSQIDAEYALMMAVDNRSINAVTTLLERGVNPNVINTNKLAALINAIINNDDKIMTELMNKGANSLDESDIEVGILMNIADEKNSTNEIDQWLISLAEAENFNFPEPDDVIQMTPLHFAVLFGEVKTVKCLLDQIIKQIIYISTSLEEFLSIAKIRKRDDIILLLEHYRPSFKSELNELEESESESSESDELEDSVSTSDELIELKELAKEKRKEYDNQVFILTEDEKSELADFLANKGQYKKRSNGLLFNDDSKLKINKEESKQEKSINRRAK